MELIHRLCLERDSTVEHGEEYDTRTPHIDIKAVATVAQDLRSDVGWRATLFAHNLIGLYLPGDTEVSDLYIAFAIEEDIVKFDIAMRNILGMNVAQSINNLLENFLSKRLLQSAAFTHVIEKITASAQLHHNDDVLLCFNCLVDFDNVVMT